MGVDLQRHIHGAVSGEILDLLDSQSRLEQPGDIGVTQDMGRVEDAPQIHQHLGLEGIAFVRKHRYDGLNLHGRDVPEAAAANVWENVLVQDVLIQFHVDARSDVPSPLQLRVNGALADTQLCGNLDRGGVLPPHHFNFPAAVQRQSPHLNHLFHPFLPSFGQKNAEKGQIAFSAFDVLLQPFICIREMHFLHQLLNQSNNARYAHIDKY